jgi:excinuclease ABC subunit C
MARDEVLRVVKRIFAIRPCRKLPKRACLRYHLGSCSGPCIGAVSEEAYRVQVERASALLRGKGSELIRSLQEEMAECSRTRNFEHALTLRDQIAAIGQLGERQHVARPRETDEDVIGYTVSGDTMYLMVFTVERGLLSGKQEYSFDYREDAFDEFLVQYYADTVPPSELILPHEVDEALPAYLAGRKGRIVQVTVPKSGEKKKLLEMVEKNIEHSFLKNELKIRDLQAGLGLPDPPAVIECFDISHLSGTSMVGSMVQFRNGEPDKKNYRRFLIKTVEGIDDFASIAEVVRRRYKRLIEEDAELPDLIVIDGVTAELGLGVPVIAIAKREEEIFRPGEMLPLRLDPKGMALHYLQEIRNEAHRFAIAYNRLLRSKSLTGKKSRPGGRKK